jgi:hypothetical protein
MRRAGFRAWLSVDKPAIFHFERQRLPRSITDLSAWLLYVWVPGSKTLLPASPLMLATRIGCQTRIPSYPVGAVDVSVV